MKLRFLAFAAIATFSTVPVIAADMVYGEPSPPSAQQASAFDWSGFYLGGQGGYTRNQATAFGSDVDSNSGTAGGHAGYNFQNGNIVFGIENDFNYNFGKKSDTKVEWDASGRGRIGYALDRTLIFTTAGVAAAGTKVNVPALNNSKDEILIGWTAGGGVEHAVTDNILVRGEYRYTDFGNKDFGSSIGEVGAKQHKVLVGASYKFWYNQEPDVSSPYGRVACHWSQGDPAAAFSYRRFWSVVEPHPAGIYPCMAPGTGWEFVWVGVKDLTELIMGWQEALRLQRRF